jgi:pimeloyl-ACP methyl ester carboxylesterase
MLSDLLVVLVVVVVLGMCVSVTSVSAVEEDTTQKNLRVTVDEDLAIAYDLSKVPPDSGSNPITRRANSSTYLFKYCIDVGLDMMELVNARGYQIESHEVTTADGYILTMFRIPSSLSASKPVILQHGLLDSSYTWINNYADQSLGYILADAGYDVWFGNNRGNRYGRKHATLDPDNKDSGFWDFSWDEMAFYDAPAMINYVLATSGSSTVSWVGHSEGTIQVIHFVQRAN